MMFVITFGFFVESVCNKNKETEWGAFFGMLGSLIVMCVEGALYYTTMG